jgi:thymidine kinase
MNSGAHYLKLYIGCMMSSKTSNLMSEINRYKHITDKIMIVSHILDKKRFKESENNLIKTHDHKSLSAIMVNQLNELKTNHFYKNKYDNATIVIIDEGQFYNDLYSFLREELSSLDFHCRKTFIVAGLSGDYNMNPIGDMIKLVPLADEIHKLTAYCVYCKDTTPASFTKRHMYSETNGPTNGESEFLVGNGDIYSPVCRMHFLT